MSPPTPATAESKPRAPVLSPSADLFLVSFLILFLELACIRWFPAHVLFLTFFTNTVLLACFLGMSVGCLAAERKQNFVVWSPVLLFVAVAAAHMVEKLRLYLDTLVDVGNQASPQLVFFGTEYRVQDLARFVIPIEALGGFFFLALALVMIGPGQELGRCLKRVPGRVKAYSLNILGSIAGIISFAACSWWELAPLWWFLPVGALVAYFLWYHCTRRRLLVRCALLVVVAILANARSGPQRTGGHTVAEIFWSPYYRVDYSPKTREIIVNQIGHQTMVSRREPGSPAYALPYLLQRDSGGAPFQDVLIIGAGSGNDVSRALQWGARHVDAVEIDPAIQRLGRRDHSDRPYDDPRVTVHLDDGRNFLRATPRQYDLIIYALVDSLVLHSSYSNIRLESYLFTHEAFGDVRRRLKPGGIFAMYNYFRQGWIVARLSRTVEQTFGAQPLVIALPYQERVNEDSRGGFTILLAGDTQALRHAFERQPAYWLRLDQASGPNTRSGFAPVAAAEDSGRWLRFGLSTVVPPADLVLPADEWPFLYLRRPMIPGVSWRGMLIMGGIALLFLLVVRPRSATAAGRPRLDGQMFFLGAGFLLIETKAVVQMALLFGSTWMVNSVVFFAVLVMILLANLYVLRIRPARLWPYYLALLASLALNCLVPLSMFLGMERTLQVAGSCALVFTPIFFAGIVFAASFGRVLAPDQAFGANIAGAMLGGL
ncbi:MAG: fused MFS/spermidine synthase, partial [Acidobacteria bacterium]|nr:fused MFS/spermidine synthase [Acidobacteriota bacterium]